MASRLTDKVAIITGGSRGIGKATAELFAQEGAKVAICSGSSVEAGEAVAAGIRENGGEALYMQVDVTDKEQVQKFIDATIEKFGTVDILVNNAGGGDAKAFADVTEEDWDHMHNLDAKSFFFMMKGVLPTMREKQSGNIINVTSASLDHAIPNTSLYVFNRAGIRALTEIVAVELAKEGIRCNCVSPGITATELLMHNPQEMIDRMAAPIPMKRLGEPAEIANAILFMASDESSYVDGFTLRVDGAWAL